MENPQTPQEQPQQGKPSAVDSLNPRERQMHDGIMDNAANTFEMAAQHFQKSNNPLSAVGEAAGRLFHTMLLSANQTGKRIPQKVSQVALKSLVEDMMEIASGIGAVEVKNQEEATKASGIAFRAAVDSYVQAEKAYRKSNKAQPQQPQPQAPQQGGMMGMPPGGQGAQ